MSFFVNRNEYEIPVKKYCRRYQQTTNEKKNAVKGNELEQVIQPIEKAHDEIIRHQVEFGIGEGIKDQEEEEYSEGNKA